MSSAGYTLADLSEEALMLAAPSSTVATASSDERLQSFSALCDLSETFKKNQKFFGSLRFLLGFLNDCGRDLGC